MITDYIGGVCPNDYRLHGGKGSTETPKSDYVIYGWPLKVQDKPVCKMYVYVAANLEIQLEGQLI